MTIDHNLASLLSRVALQDRSAFELLYRATCAHLLTVAFLVLRNRDHAEEALQEAFMNVWHNAASYNIGLATPMTWLINVVRNKSIDQLRSRKTERATTFELDDEALDVAADDSLQPQNLLDRHLMKARVDTCMSGLSASQRQALALAYYRGMVHTDIAESLGEPLGTVKAWVRRGLDRLKDCLRGAGVGT